MKNKFLAIITLILFSGISVERCNAQQPELAAINKGIELTICEKYDSALDVFQIVKDKYPEHPAGYLLCAALWQSRMMDFETNQWEQEFYREIEKTITLAKKQLQKNSQDVYANFYLGGALSYKSFQLARRKKYLPAINIALKSVSTLNKTIALDSSFCDSYLGLGSYLYWRSKITQKISWLPFFSDQRKEGIALLIKACECGQFSKWASLSNLAWIYIEEQEYSQALQIAKDGLDTFPECRFFLWPLGEAQLKSKDWKGAIATFTLLLASVSKEPVNNHYNEIVLNLKLAKCYYALQDFDQAFNASQRVINIEPGEEVRDRAKGKKQEAIKLLSQINEHSKH